MKTDRSVLTVKTQIRLLLKKQSDQGLLCLPFHLFLLDALHQYKTNQFQGQLIIFRGPNFQNSCGTKMCKAHSLIYQQPQRLSFAIALVPSYMNSSTYQHLFQNNLITRKCVYETLCPQPYACPEKRFKSERSATQTIKKLISSSTP